MRTGTSARRPDGQAGSSRTLCTPKPRGSLPGSATTLWPALTRTVEHAEKVSGRPSSRSATVPPALVGTGAPATVIVGPWPQPSLTGADPAALSALTPGTRTSETCTGSCAGMKARVSWLVRSAGLNVSFPDEPRTPPRSWPPEPVTSTGMMPDAPGGRTTVMPVSVLAPCQRIVSTGSRSPAADIQVVAGSPSKAALAMSSGSSV